MNHTHGNPRAMHYILPKRIKGPKFLYVNSLQTHRSK